MPDANIEEALVTAFFRADRRERVLTLLGRPKSRRKQLDRLSDGNDLEPGCMRLLSAVEQTHEGLLKLLEARFVGSSVYVLSDNAALDGRTMELREAVQEVRGVNLGTILYSPVSRIGYYEGEGLRERYLLVPVTSSFRSAS